MNRIYTLLISIVTLPLKLIIDVVVEFENLFIIIAYGKMIDVQYITEDIDKKKKE